MQQFWICKSPPCPAPPHHLTQFTCAQTTVTTSKTWILRVLWGKSWRFWCRLRFPTKKNKSSKLKSNKVHTFTWIHHHHRRTLQLPTTELRLPNSTQTTESQPNSTPAGLSKILATCHSVESWASPIPKKPVSGLRRLLQLPPSHLYRKWSWNESRPRLLIGDPKQRVLISADQIQNGIEECEDVVGGATWRGREMPRSWDFPKCFFRYQKGPVHTARFQEDRERERSMDYRPKSFWRSRALKVETPIHDSV
jgi:hypothetical protein